MRLLFLSLPLAIAACAGPDTVPTAAPSPQEVAATEFADVNVNAMANCVRSNATAAELALLDQGGQLAQTATRAILQRPETGDCIVAAGVNLPPAG